MIIFRHFTDLWLCFGNWYRHSQLEWCIS